MVGGSGPGGDGEGLEEGGGEEEDEGGAAPALPRAAPGRHSRGTPPQDVFHYSQISDWVELEGLWRCGTGAGGSTALVPAGHLHVDGVLVALPAHRPLAARAGRMHARTEKRDGDMELLLRYFYQVHWRYHILEALPW